jgi:hypothetical protein
MHAIVPHEIDEAELEATAVKLRAMGFPCSGLKPFYLPARTAAEVLLISERTLRAWRAEGRGPTAHQCRGRVLYQLADVLHARVDGVRAT